MFVYVFVAALLCAIPAAAQTGPDAMALFAQRTGFTFNPKVIPGTLQYRGPSVPAPVAAGAWRVEFSALDTKALFGLYVRDATDDAIEGSVAAAMYGSASHGPTQCVQNIASLPAKFVNPVFRECHLQINGQDYYFSVIHFTTEKGRMTMYVRNAGSTPFQGVTGVMQEVVRTMQF